jgi:hypothetical protein
VSMWISDSSTRISYKSHSKVRMGGAFSSTYDWTTMLHDLFLSDPKLLRLPTIKKWLRSLFTNPDFTTEVGMPWEIFLQFLDTGRNMKIFGKGGDLTTYHSQMTLNRYLAFSVIPR